MSAQNEAVAAITTTADKIGGAAKHNSEAVGQSGKAALSGLQSLAKAYQEIITSNFERQVASFKTLASIKNPGDLFTIQQGLIKDSLEAAIADGQRIAELTKAVFSSAIDPVKGLSAFKVN